MVGHPSSGGVTIKKPYGVDVFLYQPASHPIFPLGLVTEFDVIIRLVETGLGRLRLVEAVIRLDAYRFFGILRPHLSRWGCRKCFLVALSCLIVQWSTFEVATKRLPNQQLKILVWISAISAGVDISKVPPWVLLVTRDVTSNTQWVSQKLLQRLVSHQVTV